MLVLAPTRELAVQTHQVCEQAGKECDPPISSVCVFGGVSKEPQTKALRNGAQVHLLLFVVICFFMFFKDYRRYTRSPDGFDE
jgi:hypothetical protein